MKTKVEDRGCPTAKIGTGSGHKKNTSKARKRQLDRETPWDGQMTLGEPKIDKSGEH